MFTDVEQSFTLEYCLDLPPPELENKFSMNPIFIFSEMQYKLFNRLSELFIEFTVALQAGMVLKGVSQNFFFLFSDNNYLKSSPNSKSKVSF